MRILLARNDSHRLSLSAALAIANAPKAAPVPPSPADDPLIKRFDAAMDLTMPDVKKFTVIQDDEKKVIDYQDVRIKGYLSTFADSADLDRQGEYVEKGAYQDTIKEFMSNPVLLCNHWNNTDSVIGGFTSMKEDNKGLLIEASLSNAPGVRDLRFKVAEGFLRALSIGGFYRYKEDGRGIYRVMLFEGSIVAVPANGGALFQTRALNDIEKKFFRTGAKDFNQFLRSEGVRNLSGVAA